jgi:hypothetical protein
MFNLRDDAFSEHTHLLDGAIKLAQLSIHNHDYSLALTCNMPLENLIEITLMGCSVFTQPEPLDFTFYAN